jgi:hypothetical protein
MINVSSTMLAKINSKMQLPYNQGDPHLYFLIHDNRGGQLYSEFNEYIKSGTISCTYDNFAYSLNLTLIRGNINIYGNRLFVPGARVNVLVGYGPDSEYAEPPIPLFSGTIDEMDMDPDGETFSISATSDITHLLKETSMNEISTLTGYSHVVGEVIMDQAEVPDYHVTWGTYEWTYVYKPNDSCLSALEQMYPIFPKDGYGDPGFGILEKPGGGVVFGYWRDLTGASYGVPVGQFSIDSKDCYSINIRMTGDKCYSKVRATGKAADGFDLIPVTVPVHNVFFFDVPINKIYHANFNGYTMQDDLQDWAETIASELDYQGIIATLSVPFRPNWTVGDIITITGNEFLAQIRGVITSITHNVGLDGFKTDITINTNGVDTAITGWTSQMKYNGYNRRQKLDDIVKEIADQATEQALSYYDPVSVQSSYDKEGEEVEVVEERNKTTVVQDGRSWQEIVIATGGDPIPEPEEEEGE